MVKNDEPDFVEACVCRDCLRKYRDGRDLEFPMTIYPLACEKLHCGGVVAKVRITSIEEAEETRAHEVDWESLALSQMTVISQGERVVVVLLAQLAELRKAELRKEELKELEGTNAS